MAIGFLTLFLRFGNTMEKGFDLPVDRSEQ